MFRGWKQTICPFFRKCALTNATMPPISRIGPGLSIILSYLHDSNLSELTYSLTTKCRLNICTPCSVLFLIQLWSFCAMNLVLKFYCWKNWPAVLSISLARDGVAGFYPSTFIYSRFSPFLYCLLSSVAPWGGSIVGTEGKIFEIWVCRSLENAFFLDFSWKFRVSRVVLKKSWLERYIHFSFMCVCKYLNQRVRRIDE